MIDYSPLPLRYWLARHIGFETPKCEFCGALCEYEHGICDACILAAEADE